MNHQTMIRWILCAAAICFGSAACAQTPEAQQLASLERFHFHATGVACSDCNGSGQKQCASCKGIDQTKQACWSCKGIDQTMAACWSCKGVDQTKQACWSCKGIDQTKTACWSCKGEDQTKKSCWSCRGIGKTSDGRACYTCYGSGKGKPCAYCHGSGRNKPCAYCHGFGHNKPCAYCQGTGKGKPCYSCNGSAARGEACGSCRGGGTVVVIVARHDSGDELLRSISATGTEAEGTEVAATTATTETGDESPRVLRRDEGGRFVAENGSYYGELSADTGRPKVIFVSGYYRQDGTYVRSHYRALPKGSVSARGPPVYTQRGVAENGSYHGEPNQYGVPKTVHVRGYYRKDGTYVRGHYRSRPR
jgi:hypothetical protein